MDYIHLSENEISTIIVNTCFQIHKKLGPGLLESVYEEILFYELCNMGLEVERQKTIPVVWKGLNMNHGFRADLILNKKVIIEIKSVEAISSVHMKKVLTYLKLLNIKLGLLVNFNESLIKHGIKRIVNNL
ncbi:MAG: GxxExxY protein [Balneolaceae bacterium]